MNVVGRDLTTIAANPLVCDQMRFDRILTGEALYIAHEQGIPVRADQYLRTAGLGDFEIAKIFDDLGRWHHKTFGEIDLLQRSLQDLAAQLLQSVNTIYAAAQTSLEQVNWFGYNDHGPLHAQRVTEAALQLAQQLKLTDYQTRVVTIAAVCHDLGNLINRDNHSLYSPYIMRALFPQISHHPELLEAVDAAIRLHNSAAYRPELRVFESNRAERRLEGFGKVFSVESATVLIADKIQFQRERLNRKAHSQQAIDAHKYSELALLLEHSAIQTNEASRQINWSINFRPDVRSEELPLMAGLFVPSQQHVSGYKVVVSEKTKTAAVNGKSYLLSASELFWQTSRDVIERAVEGLFSVYNGSERFQAERVTITIQDKGAKDFKADKVIFDFDRALVYDQFALQKKRMSN